MNIRLSVLVLSIAAGAAPNATAGFYVNGNAPNVTTAHLQMSRKISTTYLTFNGASMSRSSREKLDNLSEQANEAESIVINAYAATKVKLVAANRRVSAVRNMLERLGVPSENIRAVAVLDLGNDPMDTDVRVAFHLSQQRSHSRTIQSAEFVPVSTMQAAIVPTVKPVTPGAGGDSAKLDFVRKIMAMASNKIISSDSAVKLVNDYLANMAPNAGPIPQTPPQGSPARPGTAQIVPFGEVPRVWTLAANKSLRDNLGEWSATAGYAQLNWNASNLYQITYSSSYTGTFLEVLSQVATAVPGIDFRISNRQRIIDVVDAEKP